MTQPVATPENPRRNRNIWIAIFAVGLVIGLGLGIIVSVAFILPSMTKVFIINAVQVSGTVSGTFWGSIQFVNWNETISTRYSHVASIVGGHYSIVLSGGQSYTAYIGTGQTGYSDQFSLYVPSNVTTLTANF